MRASGGILGVDGVQAGGSGTKAPVLAVTSCISGQAGRGLAEAGLRCSVEYKGGGAGAGSTEVHQGSKAP
jgi:hypothetical protein